MDSLCGRRTLRLIIIIMSVISFAIKFIAGLNCVGGKINIEHKIRFGLYYWCTKEAEQQIEMQLDSPFS